MDARCTSFNHGLHQFEDVQWPTKASLGIGHDRCEPVSITLALRHLDLVCPLQSLVNATYNMRNAIGWIETLIGIHVPG